MAAAVAAPEVICAKTHYDGEKADIWSCGVMLYVMLFCEYPFERPEDDADKHGFQKVQDVDTEGPCMLSRHSAASVECVLRLSKGVMCVAQLHSYRAEDDLNMHVHQGCAWVV